jgi:hypothetical protein
MRYMSTSNLVYHERATSILFQYIMFVLLLLKIFWCTYAKCSILYKSDGLRLYIYVDCSWEMALNVDLGASFDNMWE